MEKNRCQRTYGRNSRRPEEALNLVKHLLACKFKTTTRPGILWTFFASVEEREMRLRLWAASRKKAHRCCADRRRVFPLVAHRRRFSGLWQSRLPCRMIAFVLLPKEAIIRHLWRRLSGSVFAVAVDSYSSLHLDFQCVIFIIFKAVHLRRSVCPDAFCSIRIEATRPCHLLPPELIKRASSTSWIFSAGILRSRSMRERTSARCARSITKNRRRSAFRRSANAGIVLDAASMATFLDL